MDIINIIQINFHKRFADLQSRIHCDCGVYSSEGLALHSTLFSRAGAEQLYSGSALGFDKCPLFCPRGTNYIFCVWIVYWSSFSSGSCDLPHQLSTSTITNSGSSTRTSTCTSTSYSSSSSSSVGAAQRHWQPWNNTTFPLHHRVHWGPQCQAWDARAYPHPTQSPDDRPP